MQVQGTATISDVDRVLRERPRVLEYSSAGSSNSGVTPLPAIYINELMAANTLWLDLADGDSDDWFELYNFGNVTINAAPSSGFDLPQLHCGTTFF